MLNYVQARKEETRQRIVETASRLFQEKGVDGVGVDEIMREAGLTHGGFYGHFRNKEQLIAEACALAVEHKSAEVRVRLAGLEPEAAFEAFITDYLSCVEGADCPFSMLGGDVARRSDEVRQAYTRKVSDLVDYMTAELGCDRDHALMTFAAVVGASTVARASSDEAFSAEVVGTVRNELLRMWREKCAPSPRQRSRKGPTAA